MRYMLVPPHNPIKNIKYLVWDLNGTIDALPLKLKNLSVKDKKHFVWRYKDILSEGLGNKEKRKLERIAKKAEIDFEKRPDANPLHFITTLGWYALHKNMLSREERNIRMQKLFAEIAEEIGFIEQGYNEHVANFILSNDFFVHYLITNLPKEPASLILSEMGLLNAFERMFFYVIKSNEELLKALLLKTIVENRRKSRFLVIGDEYFKEIKIAHDCGIPTAWINPGMIIKTEHYFHPELVANSPNELVLYLDENYF